MRMSNKQCRTKESIQAWLMMAENKTNKKWLLDGYTFDTDVIVLELFEDI